jgi:uncharacterized protein
MNGSPDYEPAQASPQARSQAALALLLIVPAQSLGVLLTLILFPGTIGQVGAVLCQVWMLALPLWWTWTIDRAPIRFSAPKLHHLLVGLVLGVLMFACILLPYWFVGRSWLDASAVQDKVQTIGLGSPTMIVLSGLYFTLINSLFEEYIWRWFVYRKCQILLPGMSAVLLSALLFTLHHIIVLAVYGSGQIVLWGAIGVFAAGVIWSLCYQRYRSIMPSYISHVWADAALQVVTWIVLFGKHPTA